MTDRRDFNDFEMNLIGALQVDPPSTQFIGELWERIERQPRPVPPRPEFDPGVRQFRWLYAAATLALLLLVFLAVGPTRVMAALQALIKYIPGLGYVDDSSNLRIVKPYKETIGGVTFAVPAGVLDEQKTVLRFSYTGADLPTPGPEGPGELCLDWPSVRLPDGTLLSNGGGEAGTEDHVTVNGSASFAAVPAGIDAVDLVFPCLMYTEKKTSPKDVALHLQLAPMPADYPAYPVVELTAPSSSPSAAELPSGTPTASRTPAPGDGIWFSVDRMAETPDGYLFEGSLTWPAATYSFANLWAFDIHVTDANGREVAVEESSELNLTAGYQKGKLGWAVRSARKDFAFPLTFRLAKINVSKSVAEPAFEVDLGEAPRIGQSWNVTYRRDVQGIPVTVTRVTLAEQPGGFSKDLYLNVEGESPTGNDVSLSFKPAETSKFASCAELSGSGGGGGGGGGMDASGNGGSFSTLVFLGCHPKGRVAIVVDSVSYDLTQGWSAQVEKIATEPLPLPTP